jgi:hypothetical protein
VKERTPTAEPACLEGQTGPAGQKERGDHQRVTLRHRQHVTRCATRKRVLQRCLHVDRADKARSTKDQLLETNPDGVRSGNTDHGTQGVMSAPGDEPASGTLHRQNRASPPIWGPRSRGADPQAGHFATILRDPSSSSR